jgi:NADPH:quinone reductase-like Zn-dependent oxidoreductase
MAATMRALEAPGYGPISSLTLTSSRPKPQLPAPLTGQSPMVLVKVVAAALNPVDSKILTGRRFPVKSWPHVLGCDMSGTRQPVQTR